MAEITATRITPLPPRRELRRPVAAAVMALTGAIAAVLALVVSGASTRWPDWEALALLVPSAALGAALTAWVLMGWAIARTQFGWGVALVLGVVTALLAYIPFAVSAAVGIMIWEAWEAGLDGDTLKEGAGAAVMIMFLGPIFTGFVTLPFGAVGGLICHALSTPSLQGQSRDG